MTNKVPMKLEVIPVQEKQKQKCIELLEAALKDGKKEAGYDAVLIVATYPDDTSVRHMYSCGVSTIQIVGMLEHLKHELLANMHETDVKDPHEPK